MQSNQKAVSLSLSVLSAINYQFVRITLGAIQK